MLRLVVWFLVSVAWVSVAWVSGARAEDHPIVDIHTNLGVITLELNATRAPISVQNFLDYVLLDGYAGAVFHRVIPEFMIQTGGYYETLADMDEGETIPNEADNGLKNIYGSVAMARSDEIDSAGRQFFINVNNNTHLDHSADSCTREQERRRVAAAERGLIKPLGCKSFGYTVFGQVTEGFDVVAKIENLPTESRGGFEHLPIEAVTVEKVTIRDPS